MNESMQSLTGVSYETSEQHREISSARQERDSIDTLEIMNYLQEHDPFKDTSTLHNIATGVTAESPVNVHQAKQIGEAILQTMDGANICKHSFWKKDQVVTFAAKTHIKINNRTVSEAWNSR